MTTTFVGLSTGRAGSMWTARVMASCGWHVTHEKHFVAGQTPAWPAGLVGEWSAQAAPHVDTIRPDWVFWQIRDPVATVNSLLGFGLFHHPEQFGAQGRAIFDHVDLDWSDPVRAACGYVVGWSQRCAQAADVVWRVEDFDVEWLENLGGLLHAPTLNPERALAAHTVGVNSRGDAWQLTPDAMTAPLRALAERWGYL